MSINDIDDIIVEWNTIDSENPCIMITVKYNDGSYELIKESRLNQNCVSIKNAILTKNY